MHFRERAQLEALRYGSDPWVFVRELLQNARDAGARRVAMTAQERDGVARVACRDDGGGMTFEHARRYLFALYASSKERERGAAGRFGVGFWSVLRFAPARIVVRSWPARGEPWELELDGALVRAERRTPPGGGRGTEVVLDRPGPDPELARRVRDAVFQSARFLRRRDDPRRPLRVEVNGEAVAAAFELPPPSASFRAGRLRGVVGLGPEARVELFAQGLRVRSATALQDLLSPDGRAADAARVAFPAIARGVAPQALLDGDGLEPLLARSDVRENRSLQRLVGLAQRELRRLVERQIEALRPQPRWRRARRAVAWGSLALAAGGLVAWAWMVRETRTAEASAAPAPAALARFGPRPAAAAQPALRPYRDLGALYPGPRADALERRRPPLALRYAPPEATLVFAAVVLERPLEPTPPLELAGEYAGASCEQGCVDVTLAVEDGPGPLRLPVPTGQRLVADSVRLADRATPVFATPADEPVLVLDAPFRGIARYRTGPAVATDLAAPAAASLPSPLREVAARLRSRPASERVPEATAWVRRRLVYSTTPEVASRHRAAFDAGKGLAESALDVGAGDCDVQNAVLAALLQAAGVPARLAIGYVGIGGQAVEPLHAWVEYGGPGEPRQIADASVAPAGSPGPTPLAPPALATVAAKPGREGLAAAVAAAAGLALVGLILTRPRRVVRLDPEQDLAAMIQGALQRPEAFRHAPALFERPLVPLHGSRLLSLGVAWDLAARRRLFASGAGSSLARRAARRNAAVLDTRRPEARAVADALGAPDLDEWDVFLARSRSTPLLDAVDARLRRLGEAWEVRAADGLGAAAVLDLPAGDGFAGRVLVLDARESWLAAAERRYRERPHEAVLVAVDRLAATLGLGDAERAQLLAPLAREALGEATR